MKVDWLKRFGKLKIRARHGLSHFRIRLRRMRKTLVGVLSLLLVLAMVFGLSVVRNPVPTAGLPAVALA